MIQLETESAKSQNVHEYKQSKRPPTKRHRLISNEIELTTSLGHTPFWYASIPGIYYDAHVIKIASKQKKSANGISCATGLVTLSRLGWVDAALALDDYAFRCVPLLLLLFFPSYSRRVPFCRRISGVYFDNRLPSSENQGRKYSLMTLEHRLSIGRQWNNGVAVQK